MFNHKLSLGFTFILIIISSTITYFAKDYVRIDISQDETDKNTDTENYSSNSGDYRFDRLQGYKLIKPLVYSEPAYESPKYSNLKSQLTYLIDGFKKTETLISASVYLKDMEQGHWMCLNDSESYYPGSLIKLAGLISYLRMSENQPGLLDKKLSFDSTKYFIPNQTFNSKQIEPGKKYTIRQLLKYMISYSDNNATYLLKKNVDQQTFYKTFGDLNIPAPKPNTSNYKMTARDFSVFFEVLYDASYLNREDSEFAAELLEACDFKSGLVAGLPENTLVAHKFGEMGDTESRQLHESGLIYLNNSAYLITVMTKGYDTKELPGVISKISKMVHDDFKLKENK